MPPHFPREMFAVIVMTLSTLGGLTCSLLACFEMASPDLWYVPTHKGHGFNSFPDSGVR